MTASSGALFALACNAVAGLDGFKEVDCFEAPCVDAGLPDVVPVEAASDARPDVILTDAEPIADGGVFEHRTWAHWKMPNPDAGGAPLLPNLMKYDSGLDPSTAESVVTDIVTGLQWQGKVRSSAVTTIAEALNECAKPGGWRVPTRIELVTLIDFTRKQPALHDVFSAAPNTPRGAPNQSQFWSASRVFGQNAYWSVDLDTGAVQIKSGNTVRCVRGGPTK
ncbi:MAG: hypothetical protein JWM74_3617 [Myxococcaceae bacterium]|nr:hypothetical protein [Myxococcaceae bacterium]